MIPILKLTISRGTDPALVVRNLPTAGSRFQLTDEALGFPTFPYRYSWAPDSDYDEGKELLAAVRDQGTLPAVLHVFGDSIDDLLDAKLELEAAFAQPSYTVAIRIGLVDLGPWPAFPSSPGWGDSIDFGLAAQCQTRATLQILVNPS